MLSGSFACVRQGTDKDDTAEDKATKEQADKEKDYNLNHPEER